MNAAPGRPATPWRSNIEAAVMAVVVALSLKLFLIEAYKIPTGSMQPTLMGNDAAGIYDRILVDKLTYRLRDPMRFEVVVFRFPLERSKNFVKRILGMPGEELRIQHGDVQVRSSDGAPWKPLDPPRRVQRELWKRLHAVESQGSPWQPLPGTEGWSCAGLEVLARGSGAVSLKGGGGVVDEYTHGYPAGLRQVVSTPARALIRHPVGDLRIEGEVRALPGCESLDLTLTEGPRTYRFSVPGPAAEPDACPSIRARDTGSFPAPGANVVLASEEPWRLPSGRSVDIGAQNLNDALELEIDGQVVLRLEVPPAANQHNSTLELAVKGEGADVSGLSAYRDIYYLSDVGGNLPWRIPADHYYMLGDNTQDSSDSREWTLVQYAVEGAGGEARAVFGQRQGESNPSSPIYTEDRPSGFKWFVDEWGERHELLASAAPIPPARSAPCVPREMISGRAVAIFWPISLRKGIQRLKWVR